eukprot:7209319-Pyramimonas_sp.AAC.1
MGRSDEGGMDEAEDEEDDEEERRPSDNGWLGKGSEKCRARNYLYQEWLGWETEGEAARQAGSAGPPGRDADDPACYEQGCSLFRKYPPPPHWPHGPTPSPPHPSS